MLLLFIFLFIFSRLLPFFCVCFLGFLGNLGFFFFTFSSSELDGTELPLDPGQGRSDHGQVMLKPELIEVQGNFS